MTRALAHHHEGIRSRYGRYGTKHVRGGGLSCLVLEFEPTVHGMAATRRPRQEQYMHSSSSSSALLGLIVACLTIWLQSIPTQGPVMIGTSYIAAEHALNPSYGVLGSTLRVLGGRQDCRKLWESITPAFLFRPQICSVCLSFSLSSRQLGRWPLRLFVFSCQYRNISTQLYVVYSTPRHNKRSATYKNKSLYLPSLSTQYAISPPLTLR